MSSSAARNMNTFEHSDPHNIMFGNDGGDFTKLFIDMFILVAACCFTLLVGIIIGLQIEGYLNSRRGNGTAEQSRSSKVIHNGGGKKRSVSEIKKESKSEVSSPHEIERMYDHNDELQINEGHEEQLLLTSCPSEVPSHIAVIMDGNRRFGKQVHSDPLQGHWSGGQTLVDFVQWCKEDGVSILTVYAFSTENWRRDPLEVKTLMTIFAKYAERFRSEALTHNVKVNILSTERERLPQDVQQSIETLQRATATCTAFTLNICLSYGARSDIVTACRAISTQVAAGHLSADDVTEARFADFLTTASLPDPDILIRTSGEFRLSNFLLWQLAYTELFFVDKFWPQLTKVDYRRIVHKYAQRSRRYGK
mmetsp:Transcript_32467/g.54742  ORF Transcript_32467/g.54742 Transcript_32467/m.54742 type:complete len:365 (+) Transcript_32467:76-1170(+)